MTGKNWRDAMPKWAVQAAEAELQHIRLHAALSWPNDAEPESLPFRWGEYDRLIGEPVSGTYFACNHYGKVDAVSIRKRTSDDSGWKEWRFSLDGREWNSIVFRGPLYRTERDAALAHLWDQSRRFAITLANLKDNVAKARGE